MTLEDSQRECPTPLIGKEIANVQSGRWFRFYVKSRCGLVGMSVIDLAGERDGKARANVRRTDPGRRRWLQQILDEASSKGVLADFLREF